MTEEYDGGQKGGHRMFDQDDFILALTGTGSMRLACTYIGIHPRCVAGELQANEIFRVACEQIMIEQVDMFILEGKPNVRNDGDDETG
jgi:hypothetical protein